MTPNRVLVNESDIPIQAPHRHFFVTIPGLPDGRPFRFCEYHYYNTVTQEDNKPHWKTWWGPLTWIEYNPLIPSTGFKK